ncbi:MAG: hypothetical protein HZB41_09465 [Ignavibacteriae bacterium]|nr:hypothetical protein [Ignavibacteriota bacterium]
MKHIQENIAVQLSGLISSKLGLNFPKDRFRDLETGLNKAKKDFDFDDVNNFAEWLIETELNSTQIEQLASHFTIGETYFFRDIKYFKAIEKILVEEIIPKHVEKDKRIRIWSAGCSTGEEPYSISIMLSQIIPDIKNWSTTVIGTDLNSKSLKKAKIGLYKEWSFRNSPDWLKPEYFTEVSKGSYQINQKIKDMINFQYHNLALDPYPSLINNLFGFDIIFCRNVLMYFTQDLIAQVIEKFFHALNIGGLLIVSPSEASHVLFGAYESLYEPDVILYKKTNSDYIPEKFSFKQKESDFNIEKEFLNYDLLPYQKKRKKIIDRISTLRKEPEKKSVISIEIKNKPESEIIHDAVNLYNKGLFDESEKLLKSVLSSKNQNSVAMTLLSKIYANRGNTEDAKNWSQKAIDIDKLNPEPYYIQAMLLQENGDPGKAIDLFKKILYIDSKFVLAHFGLGNLLLKQGKLSESSKYFRNASRLLKDYNDYDIVEDYGGITAGRFKEIINILIENNDKQVF